MRDRSMKMGKLQYILSAAGISAALAASSFVCPASTAYDVTGGILDPSYYKTIDFADGIRDLIYPYDSISGQANIFLSADGMRDENLQEQGFDPVSACPVWTNKSGVVYEASELTPLTVTDDGNGNSFVSPGTYELNAVAYSIGMTDGAASSGYSAADGSQITDNTFSPLISITDSSGMPQDMEVSGYSYSEGDTVTLSAGSSTAPEGQVFAGWQVNYVDPSGIIRSADLTQMQWAGLTAEALSQENLSFTMGKTDQMLLFTPLYGIPVEDSSAEGAEAMDGIISDLPLEEGGYTDPSQSEGFVNLSKAAEGFTDPAMMEGTADLSQIDGSGGSDADDNINPDGTYILPVGEEQQAAEYSDQDEAPELIMNSARAPENQETLTQQYPSVMITYYPENSTEASASLQPWSEGFYMTASTAQTVGGQVFAYWQANIPDAVVFENSASPTTGLSVPGAPVEQIEIRPVYLSVHSVSVVNGSASYDGSIGGEKLEGVKTGSCITVTANTIDGSSFAGWEVSGPEGFGLDDYLKTQQSFQFTMPEGDVSFEAVYNQPQAQGYKVTVTDGTAAVADSGAAADSVMEGTAVRVEAAAKDGLIFNGWVLLDAGGTSFALTQEQISASIMTFNMPAGNITLAAQYKEAEVPLYVVNVVNQDPAATVSLVSNGSAYPAGSGFSVGTEVSAVVINSQGRDSITLTDASGNPVDYNSLEDYGSYSFIVPASDLTLTIIPQASNVKGAHLTVYGRTSSVFGGYDTTAAEEMRNEDGSVTYLVSTTSSPDAVVALTADARDEQVTVTQDGNPVELSADGLYLLKMNADSSCVLTYTKNTHTVSCTNCTAEPESFTEGSMVTLTAAPAAEGQTFAGFSVTDINSNEVELAADGDGIVHFTAPPSDVIATANYVEESKYGLTVCGGSIDGARGETVYRAGDRVNVTAEAAQDGYRFRGWSVISGDAVIEDASKNSTTVTIGNSASTIAANYELQTYKVTVESGSGSGTYGNGQSIALQADYPSPGQVFDSWIVESGEAQIDNAASSRTVGYAKSSDLVLKASYKSGPSSDDCTVTGIEEGAEYLKGTTLSFTANGAGLDNTSPNAGDYRYVPSGFSISTASGSWSSAPYTKSLAINAAGDYALNVQFSRQVYNGSVWNADGGSITKTVNFKVVNALSADTGDSSPILPLICIAVGALAAIAALVFILTRRRH